MDCTSRKKCSLQKIPEDEIGRWAKIHLEGNALALISRLGISDWKDLKSSLKHQFISRHNNQLLRMQLLKLRQLGDIQMYIHEFQAILNKIDDEMATGDQLFYFINGLQHDCRRYVKLHQPTILQSALDLCLNFEHVHTNGNPSSVPMELNFFQQQGTETKVEIMNQEILIVIIRDLISLSREDNLVETINSDRGKEISKRTGTFPTIGMGEPGGYHVGSTLDRLHNQMPTEISKATLPML